MSFNLRPIFPEEFPTSESDARKWYSKSSWKDVFPEEQLVFIAKLLKRKGARSQDTFLGLRGEWERFLLWMVYKEKELKDVNVDDVIAYLDFCGEPPVSWVSHVATRRYKPNGLANTEWRPFYVPGSDKLSRRNSEKQTIRRSRAQPSIARQFSFLNTLFNELLEEGLITKNPVPKARRESPVVVHNTEERPPKMFSKDYWHTLFTELEGLANKDPSFERPLFIFAVMKSCYLRISELSDRPHWQPRFSNFYYHQEYLFLRVMGKGRKTRSVTVPDSLLPYIERYRAYRGLSNIAMEMDDSPIVSKERGFGGMSQRHLRRIVKETFVTLSKEVSDPFLRKLAASAASHWMRHTGASLDAVWRSTVDLAAELGHNDPGTTGKKYVHSDMVTRAKSGQSRSVA